MNALPIVKYEDALWYFDARLRQLRTVLPPIEFRDLNDFEVIHFEAMVAKGQVVTSLR
jgi:hypothetical protein